MAVGESRRLRCLLRGAPPSSSSSLISSPSAASSSAASAGNDRRSEFSPQLRSIVSLGAAVGGSVRLVAAARPSATRTTEPPPPAIDAPVPSTAGLFPAAPPVPAVAASPVVAVPPATAPTVAAHATQTAAVAQFYQATQTTVKVARRATQTAPPARDDAGTQTASTDVPSETLVQQAAKIKAGYGLDPSLSAGATIGAAFASLTLPQRAALLLGRLPPTA